MGDLNYRLNASISKQDQIHGLSTNPTLLLETDQLLSLLKHESVLAGFQEEKIDFPPTYKFKPNTSFYNSKRSPSWCDRILFKGDWRCHSYRCVEKSLCSDHKPVTATLEIGVLTIDKKKQEEIRRVIEKEVLSTEGKEGCLEINTNMLEYGNVKRGKEISRLLKLVNPSQTNSYFRIVPTTQTKEWIHIEPMYGFVKPGEEKEIEVKVCCESNHARVDQLVVSYY